MELKLDEWWVVKDNTGDIYITKKKPKYSKKYKFWNDGSTGSNQIYMGDGKITEIIKNTNAPKKYNITIILEEVQDGE